MTPYQCACSVAAMIASFEKKPANGGTPTSASDPARKAHLVHRIRCPMPRMLRMSCSPESAWMTMPAAMKSRALKNACVIRWNIPFAYVPIPAPRNM